MTAIKKNIILTGSEGLIGKAYRKFAEKKGHKVFSFEPSFFNLETLSRNINLNNLSDNITVFPIALNDITKISKLNMSNNSWGSAHSTFDKEYMSSGKIMNTKFSYKTIGFSADDIAENLNIDQPTYIKIDVDGIEHLILKGGLNFLKEKKIKSISVELNEKFQDQYNEVMNIMKISNFNLKHKKHCADFDKSVQFSKVYNFVFEKE